MERIEIIRNYLGKLFAFVLMFVGAVSAYDFIKAGNESSAFSSLFGLAIGYILYLQVKNKELLHQTLTIFADLLGKVAEKISDNSSVNKDNNVQIFEHTITDPEEIETFLKHLQNLETNSANGLFSNFNSVDTKNPSLIPLYLIRQTLMKDLEEATKNEDYEKASEIKKEIEKVDADIKKRENPSE